MASPFPRGVSGLVDPDDEPYLRLLEHCAQARRGLGLPWMTRRELEALLDDVDGPPAPRNLSTNVVPFRQPRRPPRDAG